MVRHLTYSGGWKKFEALWGLVLQYGLVARMRPLLEKTLSGIDYQRQTQEKRLTPAAAGTPLFGAPADQKPST